MSLTIDQITTNMVNQLKLLDPTVSAEVGTPERKIIEAVAEMIASSQVDFSVLQNQNQLASMTGASLDAYLGNFGFGRQQPTSSSGTVTFTRLSPATAAIIIPRGTQLTATTSDTTITSLVFITVTTAVIDTGDLSADVPVQCTTPGTIGNIAANQITGFAGLRPLLGITSVTNSAAMSGGTDGESDDQLKARFQNTIFRNMAGTYDQFLALAVSATNVTKANVIGPISRYQEYIQVPAADDVAQRTVGGAYDPNGTTWPHKRTTAESTIPYSQYTYPTNFYLTNGTLDPSSATFFLPGVDYVFNAPPVVATSGSTQTTDGTNPFNPNVTFLLPDLGSPTGVGAVGSNSGGTLATATYYYKITALNVNGETLPSSEVNSGAITGPNGSVALTWTANPNATSYRIYRGTATNAESVYYTAVTNAFTDTGGANTVATPPVISTAVVYTNAQITSNALLLMEHAYISKNSRNNFAFGVFNAVDVFVNGEQDQTASSIEVVPSLTTNLLQNTNANVWTYQNLSSNPNVINFKRKIDSRPAAVGSLVIPLYWQPVSDLPQTITINGNIFWKANFYNPSDQTYYNSYDGVSVYSQKAHYILVEETNSNFATVRSRNGIEFFLAGNNYLNSMLPSDTTSYSGVKIDTLVGAQMTVTSYLYDANITNLQSIMEASKQVTTDVLVHRARNRYFQPIVTIMYNAGSTQSVVNAAIIASLAAYFQNQYYGAAIQLSDILQVIHNTAGVDNVRWTNSASNGNKVQEVNADGTSFNTGAIYFTTDFYIQDDELASSPSANQVVITARAGNTWGS